MVESVLCHAQNPWRTPDWKWHRAVEIVDEEGLPATLRRDGTAVVGIKRLVKFWRERRRIETLDRLQARQAEALLLEAFPDIYYAHMLYSTQARKSARWAVEARILAGQTDLQIATTNRCEAVMIQAYTVVFFDVRPDLDRTEFILHSVFGDSLYQGLGEQDYGTLWKLLGYFGGPAVIDAMTRRLINPTRTKKAGDVPAYFRSVVLDAIKGKAAVAALTTPVNNHTGMALIDSFADYLEMEQAIGAESNESDKILGNINSMMGILSKSFCVGSNVGALKKSPIGEELELGAMELRGDQMLRLVNGYPVEDLEELRNLKFPEP